MEQEQIKTQSPIPCVRSIKKLLPLFPLIGVVIAIALSAGLVLSFDNDIGHFEFGSKSFYIMSVGIIVSAVLSTVLGLRSFIRFSLTSFPDSEPLSTCAAYFAALMAIVESAVNFYDNAFLNIPFDGTLDFLSALLLPAVSVFLILGAHEKTRNSLVRVILGIIGALAVNVNLFARYFDFTVLPLNSPVRNLVTIAESGVLLFLFSEIRLALSHETRATSIFYVFTSVFASSAVLGISLGLCVYAFVSPYAAEIDISVYRFAFCFGVSLLALSRLRALDRCAGHYVSPLPPDEEDEEEYDYDADATEK